MMNAIFFENLNPSVNTTKTKKNDNKLTILFVTF